MITWNLVFSFALGLLLLYLLGWLLLVPMRFLWRMLAGGVLGGLLLWICNQFGGMWGMYIPLNPLTVMLAGCLGIPGVALSAAIMYLL